MNLENSKYNILTFLGLCMMAFICSLIAVNGHFPFYIPYDGMVHLGRFEQIYESLKVGKVPSEISFIGPGHNLNALMSCYPWLTSIIFIFPRFLFHNIVVSFLLGFFFINLVTCLNMYLLASEISSNKLVNFSASCIYIFNSYHLILLYARMAFGEVLAYAFLPLAVAGYLCILKNKRKGILLLAIGMSGIANSHFISLALTSFLVVIVTIYLMIIKKIERRQIRWIAVAAFFSIILSTYSIYSFLHIRLFNSIVMPYKSLVNVEQGLAFGAMFKLIITMLSTTWNVGIITMLIFVWVIVQAFRRKIPYLRSLVIFSVVVYVLVIFPVNRLNNKEELIRYFGFIQFQGRILSFFVLSVILAFILCAKNINSVTSKTIYFSMNIFLVIFAAIGIINLETNRQPELYSDRSGIDFTLSNNSFNRNVYNSPVISFEDYLPGRGTQSSDPQIGKIYKLGDSNTKLQWKKSNYNSAIFKLSAKQTKKSKLNLAFYKKINYKIFINGKRVRNLSNRRFLLLVHEGNSKLKVESNPSLLTISIFCITVIANVIVYAYVFTRVINVIRIPYKKY